MASVQSETQRFIRNVLDECGAEDVAFENHRTHPRVYFSVAGEERFYTFSVTPSCSRARQNMRAHLRRMCRDLQQETDMPELNSTIVEPRVVSNGSQALSLYEVSPEDDEPRVRDIDLAYRLGMKKPRDIRVLIRAHAQKLNEINAVVEAAAVNHTNGTKFTEYYLDRKQATFLAIRSNTPASDEVALELVEIYDRWKRGTLPMHPTANLATDASVAILTQIRDGILKTNSGIGDLRSDQSAMMDVMAGLESRIQQLEQRALPAPAELPEPKTVYTRIALWCFDNDVHFRTPGYLGRKVGCRIAAAAKKQNVNRITCERTGRHMYPVEFLDEHADQIRQWLA